MLLPHLSRVVSQQSIAGVIIDSLFGDSVQDSAQSEMYLPVSIQPCYDRKLSMRSMQLNENRFSADPLEDHLFVVGQNQYPYMGRCRKPPFLAMGVPDRSGGETRERPLILCGLKHGMR